MNFLLLLFFLFSSTFWVGALEAGIPKKTPSNPDEVMTQKFLRRVDTTLKSRDVSIISELFEPGFMFKRCQGTFDKNQTIDFLTHPPFDPNRFLAIYKSVQPMRPSSIEFKAMVFGFRPNYIEATFSLNKKDQQLEWGVILESQCPEVSRTDPRYSIEEKGLRMITRFASALESRDTSRIYELFEEDFAFKGCKGIYNRGELTGVLFKIPAKQKLVFNLLSFWEYGSSSFFNVKINGIENYEMDVVFDMSNDSEEVSGGGIFNCDKSHF
ncbi:hypothetical protein B9Z55_000020 [Caenorhabditis nigoni]|uniref:NTF2-like domain-containing protein n=1 Tax=Caenorhabditis nigoni TaxID=1611254 RepID=A0A2G5VI92_9PELO|nr:hypothetical protein B9Z55_000020 [Caenorhabditis nigoni]